MDNLSRSPLFGTLPELRDPGLAKGLHERPESVGLSRALSVSSPRGPWELGRASVVTTLNDLSLGITGEPEGTLRTPASEWRLLLLYTLPAALVGHDWSIVSGEETGRRRKMGTSGCRCMSRNAAIKCLFLGFLLRIPPPTFNPQAPLATKQRGRALPVDRFVEVPSVSLWKSTCFLTGWRGKLGAPRTIYPKVPQQ